MSITSDVQKLIVEGKIRLFKLDLSNYLDGTIFYFHGHQSFSKQFEAVAPQEVNDIYWQGQVYSAIPMSVSGLDMRTDGKASRPTLTIGNYFGGQRGGLSALCLQYKDLVGAKLSIIQTFVKYLDADNFVNGNPSAANEFTLQEWLVEQKSAEDGNSITFELSDPIDFSGQFLPSRMITKSCEWAFKHRYRGEECGYTGTKYFDLRGQATNDPSKDECGGALADCKVRFGEDEPLPFGGFPAAGMI